MQLHNFEVILTIDVGGDVKIKANDGPKRVVAAIPREVLDDYASSHFGRPNLTDEERVALVGGNLPQIGSVIDRKYQMGSARSEARYGLIVLVVEIDYQDLRQGPALSPGSLIIRDHAGWKGA